ncbi:hypothetical protein DFJ74DRAFT_755583 [Hyaloraphidium curvatum]|nr:hypothetical protein DFJ74DRAFT_755583 [Hyaloraphidium curvatum]
MASGPHPDIPIIDISPFLSPNSPSGVLDAVAAQWDAAFKASGFAILTGHGVPPSAFEELERDARAFFALHAEVKAEHFHGAYGNDSGGYTPPGIEAVGRSLADGKARPDPVENFAFRGMPADYRGKDGKPAAPFPTAQSYAERMEALLKVLHRITARSLGLSDASFFDKFFGDPTGADKNGNALRIAFYPAPADLAPELELGEERYGAHTDYQTWTILRPDPRDWEPVAPPESGKVRTRGGLEVFLEDSKDWVPVVLPPDALVVNAGDLCEVWTDDRWHSGLHRVAGMGTPCDVGRAAELWKGPDKGEGRLALVYFTGPLDKAVIEPLPGVGKGTRKAVTAGEHLRRKLGITNV